jgi:putative transposase
VLRASGLLASTGWVGSAFGNAMAESVFATLKTELIYRRSWPTRHEPQMEVFSYLEGFYNTRRRHSRLGNLSPSAYENLHLTQNEVSA